MPDDLSKYGTVAAPEADLSKYGNLEPVKQENKPNSFGEFASAALSRLNPVEAIRSIGNTISDIANHPVDTIIANSPIGAFKRAKEAFDAGDLNAAGVHVMAGMIPGGQMEEDAFTDIAHGDVAKGSGKLAGDIAAAVIPAKVIPKVAGAVSSAAEHAAEILEHPKTQAAIRQSIRQIPGARAALTAREVSRDLAAKKAVAEVPEWTPPQAPLQPIPENSPAGPPSPTGTSEPMRPSGVVQMPSRNVQAVGPRAPLRPPLAEKAPTPEDIPEAPGTSAGPVRPPLHEGTKAYLGGEDAPIAKVVENRARVANKIASAMLKQGITDAHLAQIEELPPSQARKFWEAIGAIHKGDYVPSSATIDSIRAIIKDKAPQGPKLVAKPKPAPSTGPLAKNPKALRIATSLAELMQQAERK